VNVLRIQPKLVLAVLAVGLAAALLLAPGVASGGKPQIVVRFAGTTVPSEGDEQAIAECLESEVATGGGFQIASVNPAIYVQQSVPLEPGVAGSSLWRWAVTVVNPTEVSVNFDAYVLCAAKT
jgi:hypothetical protein